MVLRGGKSPPTGEKVGGIPPPTGDLPNTSLYIYIYISHRTYLLQIVRTLKIWKYTPLMMLDVTQIASQKFSFEEF